MAEFLLELLSEEIPARMQSGGINLLERALGTKLEEHGLPYSSIKPYSTPRRLILVVSGLPDVQPDNIKETKGPKVGSKTAAIEGFLRSLGYSSLEHPEIFQKSLKGENYYFSRRSIKGRQTGEVLGQLIPEVVEHVKWPKSMRWGSGGYRWVRPIRSILCLFNGKPIVGHIDLSASSQSIRDCKLRFGGKTNGHKFLSPHEFSPENFLGYQKQLRQAFVEIDPVKRQQIIKTEALRLAEDKGLSVQLDQGLVEENSGLVEWPVVLMGSFDAEFLELPEEVLITSMISHQKYFPMYSATGDLAPWFVMVSNIGEKNNTSNIIQGNERVLKARLYDARFFWESDISVSLHKYGEELAKIVFHTKLGSIKDQVDRITLLVSTIGRYVPSANDEVLKRAAALCKADLNTEMVNEFPELQGVMGKYYALAQGEENLVAEAICNHYAPLSSSASCPTEVHSVCLALSDKIDALVGMFAAGERASGSKDPFALRRRALGVVRLILENDLRLSLMKVVQSSIKTYESQGIECHSDVASDVMVFILERFKVYLRDLGLRHDIIAASFAVSNDSDLRRLKLKSEALQKFLSSSDGVTLLSLYRRATNIVGIEEEKHNKSYRGSVAPELLSKPAEKALYENLELIEKEIAAAVVNEDFELVMKTVADLGTGVARFFDEVKVNIKDERIRINRLCLLGRVEPLLKSIADLSVIEG